LSTVFGYSAHRLKCQSNTANQTPSEFLRSLFFAVSTITPPADNNLSGPFHKHRHRRVSNSRNSAGKSPIAPSISIGTARSRRTSTSRSASHPIESKPSITTLGRPQLGSEDADPKASNNVEVYPQRPSFHPTGAQTDTSVQTLASSIKTHLRNVSRGSTEALKLPSAVVVSGLEFASLPSQKAVLRTLAERKIIVSDGGIFGHDQDGLSLELPDGFFMVYVCRSDPQERPPIYKSLVCITFTEIFFSSVTISFTARQVRNELFCRCRCSDPLSNAPISTAFFFFHNTFVTAYFRYLHRFPDATFVEFLTWPADTPAAFGSSGDPFCSPSTT